MKIECVPSNHFSVFECDEPKKATVHGFMHMVLFVNNLRPKNAQ